MRFGFTVNTLTLLSMVLAIGLVVDDAIVVLENVHRHIEDGMEPNKAAVRGINEIAFAVIAMTLTLVAVYAPMAFSTGRTGKLFIEFALTLAGAVLVSGFVALTLTPMMCAKLLRHDELAWLALQSAGSAGSRLCRAATRLAARGAVGASGHRPARALRRRRQLLLLHASALGARAGRGSRHDQRHRRGARRRDDEPSRPTMRAASRTSSARFPEVETISSSSVSLT
jgi:multidrug efflux pump subunit AcrB